MAGTACQRFREREVVAALTILKKKLKYIKYPGMQLTDGSTLKKSNLVFVVFRDRRLEYRAYIGKFFH